MLLQQKQQQLQQQKLQQQQQQQQQQRGFAPVAAKETSQEQLQQQQQQRHMSVGDSDQDEVAARRPSCIAESAVTATAASTEATPSGATAAATVSSPEGMEEEGIEDQKHLQRPQPQLHPGQQPQPLWQQPGLQQQQQEQQQQPPPSGMTATDFKCLTCGGPILENTTSTTSCVKCARLRTRRKNFAHPGVNW